MSTPAPKKWTPPTLSEDRRVLACTIRPGQDFGEVITEAAAAQAASYIADSSIILTLSLIDCPMLTTGATLAQVEKGLAAAGLLHYPAQVRMALVERMPRWVEDTIRDPQILLAVWEADE